MALADRLAAGAPGAIHGLDCSVGVLLDALPDDEAAALRNMLGDRSNRGWTARDIWEAVLAEGHSVSYQQINRHRNGQCRCKDRA